MDQMEEKPECQIPTPSVNDVTLQSFPAGNECGCQYPLKLVSRSIRNVAKLFSRQNLW